MKLVITEHHLKHIIETKLMEGMDPSYLKWKRNGKLQTR
jgi:hypothetical protein